MNFQTTTLADESSEIWRRLPLTAESLDSRGLYIFDDGFRFVIWFGRMLSPDIAVNLLGADFSAEYSKVSSWFLFPLQFYQIRCLIQYILFASSYQFHLTISIVRFYVWLNVNVEYFNCFCMLHTMKVHVVWGNKYMKLLLFGKNLGSLMVKITSFIFF